MEVEYRCNNCGEYFYCGGGEIGRHAGLKILWALRPFGFKSRSPHTSIVRSKKKDFTHFFSGSFFCNEVSRSTICAFSITQL